MGSLNDVATGMLARRFRTSLHPVRPHEPSSRIEPRCPPAHAAGAQERDPGRGVHPRLEHERPHPRRALGRARRSIHINASVRPIRWRPQKDKPARTAPVTAAPRTIRVAIVGMGNCANSLLQGVEYYKTPTTTIRPRPDARQPAAGTTSATPSSSPPSTSRQRGKVGGDMADAMWAPRTTRSSSPRSGRPAVRSRVE